MLIGALTAAGTFFVLMLTDFRGIQELGLIAGLAILIAWVGDDDPVPRRPRVRGPPPRGAAARQRRPRAHQLERIRVPLLDRLVDLPPHRADRGRPRHRARDLGRPAGRLRLQRAQPPGQGHRVGGLGAAHPGRHRPLRLQRAVLRLARSRSCARSRPPSRSCRRSPTWTRCSASSPTTRPRRSRSSRASRPLVAPIRVGRSSPVDLDRLKKALADIKRRFDVVAAEAGAKLPAEIRVVREKTIAVIRLLERSRPRVRARPRSTICRPSSTATSSSKFYSGCSAT